MTDFHSHVLPCVDDGSKSIEMSGAMLRASYSQGVRLMAATPHFYAHRHSPERFLEKRQAAYESLHLDDSSMPELILGAEVSYFAGMSRSEALGSLRLGSTELILVELPFSGWTATMAAEICSLHRSTGLTPVLAHIERYRKTKNYSAYLEQFLESGVLLQCNAEFFLAPFMGGKAMKMLRSGMISFLGSDCHDLEKRPPNLGQAREKISSRGGSQLLRRMDEYAEALLRPAAK